MLLGLLGLWCVVLFNEVEWFVVFGGVVVMQMFASGIACLTTCGTGILCEAQSCVLCQSRIGRLSPASACLRRAPFTCNTRL